MTELSNIFQTVASDRSFFEKLKDFLFCVKQDQVWKITANKNLIIKSAEMTHYDVSDDVIYDVKTEFWFYQV